MDNLMLIDVSETHLYLPLEVTKDGLFYGINIQNLDDLLANKERCYIEQFYVRYVNWYDVVAPFDYERVNLWLLKQKLQFEKAYSWQIDLREINLMSNVCDYFCKKFSEMQIGEWYANEVKTFYYMKIDALHYIMVEPSDFYAFMDANDKDKWVDDYLKTAPINDFPRYAFRMFKVVDTDFKKNF